MFNKIAAAAFLALLLPGLGRTQDVTPEVRVSYRDLDLRNAEGVRTLDRRLAKATQTVCPEDGPGMAFRVAAARCRKDKLDAIAAQRAHAIASATPSDFLVASAR